MIPTWLRARHAATVVVRLSVALATLACTPLLAEPVWIASEGGSGQGHTFMLGRVCYAYTAGHVVRTPGAEASLTDREGYQIKGRTIAVDKRLDLGLIELPEGATRGRELCVGSAAPTMVRLESAMARPRRRGGAPDIWLDMITSQGGGLSRFELDLAADNQDRERLSFVPGRRRQGPPSDMSTQSGDSGASVWMSDTDSENVRYDQSGAPTVRRHNGNLLGVHVGTQSGRSVAVRADLVHEFILQALRPVRWSEITVEPASVSAVTRQRGPFDPPERAHLMRLSDQQLDHLSFELDLGKRDHNVVGLRVDLVPAKPNVARSTRPPTLRVTTSQFRPGEAESSIWKRGDCERDPRRTARPSLESATVECMLRAARNVRGLRVEFSGNPSTLRRIVVLLE